MNFKGLFGIFIILSLILLIPSGFASDEVQDTSLNLTDAADGNPTINSYPDDLTSKSRDYYFNSSSDVDGSGTIDDPYKYITTARIKDSSTIHLADGEYLLDDGKTLNDVSIVGEHAERTILRYSGDEVSGVFTLNFDSYLSLKNVTLIGFNINLIGATLEANNTIFKDTVGSLVDSEGSDLVNSAVHSFGGTIFGNFDEDDYYIYPSYIYLDSCTFINNTAGYGGAIYMSEGYMSISNSWFINNTAYSYGGAIAALYETDVNITNTRFINDKSVKDAGGAIYLLYSNFYSNNMSVANCSGTFGGAIASLASNVDLKYLNATGNSAKYQGGAIYQIYNDTSINYCSFTNNTAYDGGAIFADDLKVFDLAYNNFEENKAISMAGAVYLLMVSRFNENDNNYIRNKANSSDDLYRTDKFLFNIGNGNYTLIYSDYEYVGKIPKSYDLRDYNYVTSVKDQKNGGNCWAFATIAALESSILKASGIYLDLSEDNLKNLMALFSDYGRNKETNEGGIEDTAIGYLAGWLGPVNESLDEYDDYGMLSALFNSFTHVQNVVFLTRNSLTDNDAIKRAILNYGAVYSGIYYDDDYYSEDHHSYYQNTNFDSTNHAIVIVGWDDNYDKRNFLTAPSKNGAWIAKNSWADDWGEDGYFYISYYDRSVAGYSESAFAFVFNDSERYDKNYQYDLIGMTDFCTSYYDTVWVENIFESTGDELLAAVSTYFRKTTDYELSIFVNDDLVLTRNGTCTPGYTTINLGTYIALSAGDKFCVRFKLTCDEEVEFAVCEKSLANKLTYTRGVSFYSEDGVDWDDLYSARLWIDAPGPQVASIKAFTKLCDFEPDVQLKVSTDNNMVNVFAVVSHPNQDVIYCGDFRINIDGADYLVPLENSMVNYTHVINSLGKHQINITYKNYTYNTTVNIEKIDVGLNVVVNIAGNDAVFNVKSSINANCGVNLIVNNQPYSVNLVNGEGRLAIKDSSDSYEIHAGVDEGDYVGDFDANFIKTKMIAGDFLANYDLDGNYSVQLKDCFDRPIPDCLVYFVVGDTSYSAFTDSQGIAAVSIHLPDRNVKAMTIRFDGYGEYLSYSAGVNVAIKSTVVFLASNYLVKTMYQAVLFDVGDNPLAFTQFNVVINGRSYWYFTDEAGRISLPLDVSAGSYGVQVINHVTGETAYQTIKVVSRIMENRDMTVYYLSSSSYSMRIYGDNGLPVGAGEVVKISVNKHVYSVSTDANGYARFKISLSPKTYTITASYKGVKVSNKIVVKPLLTAKNISKKKAKKIKFQAKLVNTHGKPVKGKKIIFKIKGKTYKAKTNKKGIAKIYIKNLKVGKYSITVKYGKSKIKNTIRIRK